MPEETTDEFLARLDREQRSQKRQLALLSVGVTALLLALLFLQFDLFLPLLRPAVMRWGTPATAIISRHYVLTGRRTAGNYIEVNYQYSKDYAPRVEMQVDDVLYAALPENSHPAIHYLPHCPACVALDDDKGASSGTAKFLGLIAVVAAGAALLSRASDAFGWWLARRRASRL